MSSIPELLDRLDKLSDLCYKADEAYVEAKEAFDLLDDLHKIKFEQIVERQHGDKMNYREHMARISEEWIGWLKTYAKFRYDKNKAELIANKYKREHTGCMMRISSLNKELATFSRR